MKEIAKKYIESGFGCVPTKDNKAPFCKEDWTKGISDLSLYEKSYGIGIICGKLSGGLECLDFDNHFSDAKERITEFITIPDIKELYDKYNFPIESTVNGGYHLLYRCDITEGNQKLAQKPKKNEQGKWIPDTIIETRGNNGYFVCAPTKGYKVIKNDILVVNKITSEERNIILSICRSYNEWTKVVPNEYEQKDKPGDIYNNSSDSIQDMKNVLMSHGWKELDKGQWTRPGKSKGVSATIGKIAPNVFYVFSANAYPFDQESAYTPFQVLALLEYNSDFKACAKYLAEKLGLNKQVSINKKPEIKTEDEKKALLERSLINTDIEIEKPPIILYITDSSGVYTVRKRFLTLGNFSAIIGKAKSRKTYALSMITAALIKPDNLYNKFHGRLPEDKKQILYFDTEQGLYDSANVVKRIERLAEQKCEYFGGFNIREFSPIERCELIEYALSLFTNLGFVAIDGVADLAKAINDEEEGTRVTGLLMKWTKQYNCHVSTIIHQNKNDNFATGHLGSSIMKKAEIVISTSKEKGSGSNTVVSCDISRGIDFDDFSFFINESGLPELSIILKKDAQVDKWYE